MPEENHETAQDDLNWVDEAEELDMILDDD